MAKAKGENPGEYVNGGIMPFVGGELARGAFRYGAETYGFETLARYHFLIGQTGASYLWYYPAGNPGKSGLDTIPTDGWGASAMLGALMEGAAGIEDNGALYRDVTLSPRWTSAGDVKAARVVARYAASDGYIAYRWERDDHALRLTLTGSGNPSAAGSQGKVQLRMLLPESVERPATVTLNGKPQPIEIDTVFGSRYVQIAAPTNSLVEVAW
jgi:hypothetical protein